MSQASTKTIQSAHFDRVKFQQADQSISTGTHNNTDSETMSQVLEELNEVAREAASERYTHPVVRTLYKTWITLVGKNAVTITREQARGIEKTLQQSKAHLQGIDHELRAESRRYEQQIAELRSTKESVDIFYYGVRGYAQQITELETLVVAHRTGKKPRDVQLVVLDSECYDFDIPQLEQLKSQVQTKKRVAELELSELYARASITSTKLEQSNRTLQVLRAQYNHGHQDMVSQLEQLCATYSPEFMVMFEQQLRRAKLQERVESAINTRTRVAETVSEYVESNLDVLLNPYQASFSSNANGNTIGKRLEDALDTWAQTGEVGREALRTKAEAGFNQFLV
jgi:hypothetical protein